MEGRIGMHSNLWFREYPSSLRPEGPAGLLSVLTFGVHHPREGPAPLGGGEEHFPTPILETHISAAYHRISEINSGYFCDGCL